MDSFTRGKCIAPMGGAITTRRPTLNDLDRISVDPLTYLEVVHTTGETRHFLSDANKLIGFTLWDAFSSTRDPRLLAPVTSLAMQLALSLHGFMVQSVAPGTPQRAYADYILAQFMYRPQMPVADEGTIYPLSVYHEMIGCFRGMDPGIAGLLEDPGLWSDALHALALFELCVWYQIEAKERGEVSDHVAPYLPRTRAFNSLVLVNYFYLPNGEIWNDLEEIFLKAQMDTQGRALILPLQRLVEFLQQTSVLMRLKIRLLSGVVGGVPIPVGLPGGSVYSPAWRSPGPSRRATCPWWMP